MKSIDLVIDIGSKNTTVYEQGKGLRFKEPTVALVTNRGNKMVLVESGRAAAQIAERDRVKEQLLHPVKEGAIFHERAAVLMYRDFIDRVLPRSPIKPKIKAIACVSCGLTSIEKKDIENVLVRAGVGEVTLVDSPIAAAEYLGVNNSLIIDIGGSKTEIAVVGNTGIITGCSLNIGGDAFNQAIMDYVTDVFRQKIQYSTAEKIKKTILSLNKLDNVSCSVNCKSISANTASSIKLSSTGIRQAITPLLDKIAEAVTAITYQIPENIAGDVYESGMHLCGGSANIPAIDRYFADKLQWDAAIINEPDNACAVGAAHFFENTGRLSRLLNLSNLK